jgi:hypothetical protein
MPTSSRGNLFQTVVPPPFERLAVAARWDEAGQTVSRPRLREWRLTGTNCAARPRRIQFSSKFVRRHGHWQHASCTVRSKYAPAAAKSDKRVSR